MEDIQERKLIANIWRTPTGEILQSKHRHDFVMDEDGNFLDGGIGDYARLGGSRSVDWDNLCVYSDDSHEKKRESFFWGTRGPSGDQPIKWLLLKEMHTDHIESILETQWHISEHIRDMFVDEIEYRKGLV